MGKAGEKFGDKATLQMRILQNVKTLLLYGTDINYKNHIVDLEHLVCVAKIVIWVHAE